MNHRILFLVSSLLLLTTAGCNQQRYAHRQYVKSTQSKKYPPVKRHKAKSVVSLSSKALLTETPIHRPVLSVPAPFSIYAEEKSKQKQSYPAEESIAPVHSNDSNAPHVWKEYKPHEPRWKWVILAMVALLGVCLFSLVYLLGISLAALTAGEVLFIGWGGVIAGISSLIGTVTGVVLLRHLVRRTVKRKHAGWFIVAMILLILSGVLVGYGALISLAFEAPLAAILLLIAAIFLFFCSVLAYRGYKKAKELN